MRTTLVEAVTAQLVAERAQERLTAAVAAARADGASWAEVGAALGMNRSTARSVYEPRVERYRREAR